MRGILQVLQTMRLFETLKKLEKRIKSRQIFQETFQPVQRDKVQWEQPRKRWVCVKKKSNYYAWVSSPREILYQ